MSVEDLKQYRVGWAVIDVSTPQLVTLEGLAVDATQVSSGGLFRFEADPTPGYIPVASVVAEDQFTLASAYSGGRAYGEPWEYLVVRDITSGGLILLHQGDRDIREAFNYNMALLDGMATDFAAEYPLVAYFEAGVRALFDQDTAPLGWTRYANPDLNDRLVLIVSGSRIHGGTWLTETTVHSHEVPFTTDAFENFQYERVSMPTQGAFGGSGQVRQFGVIRASASDGTLTINTLLSGPSVGGTESSWRPLHRDMIVCIKGA